MLQFIPFRWPRRPEAPPVPLTEHIAAVHALREVLDEALHAYRAAILGIAEHSRGPADLLEAHRRHLALLAGMVGPNPSKAHLIEVRERLAEELRAFGSRLPHEAPEVPAPAGDAGRPPLPPALCDALQARHGRAPRYAVALLEMLPLAKLRRQCGDSALGGVTRELERRLRAALEPETACWPWGDRFVLLLDAPPTEAARIAERCAQSLTGVYAAGDTQVTIACTSRVWEPPRSGSFASVLDELYCLAPIQTGLDHAVSPSISVSRR